MEWIKATADTLPPIGKKVVWKWIWGGLTNAYYSELWIDLEYGTIFSTWDNYVDPLFQECYWLKED